MGTDLFVYSTCAWQRNMIDLYEGNSKEEKASIFAGKLTEYYETLIENFFGNMRFVFNPYNFTGDSKRIGLELTISPSFREINYFYKFGENKFNFIDRFPTWYLSFRSDDGQEVKMHDPEHGIMMSGMRGPDRVYRIVDFEWNSPFPGVTMAAPDQLAIYDLWEEIKNIIKSHFLSEPYPLLQERASFIARKLPSELSDIKDIEKFDIAANTLLDGITNPREKTMTKNDIDEFRYYLYTLKDNIFSFQLPEPDIEPNGFEDNEIWKRYSDDQLVNYLSVFFSTFVQIYRRIVEKNFKFVSHRMNLYNQWPVQVLITLDRKKEVVRVFSIPEDDEGGIKIANLPPDVPTDLSVGKLIIDQVSYESYVKKALKTMGRYKTNSYPVDKLMNIKDLFSDTPLNDFTYLWIKSEIADILQIPFSGNK
jgi:hypothetical protein